MKTPAPLTPAALRRTAAKLNRLDNASGWAKADLARRAQCEELPHWYAIMAAELGCEPRYCFALARTAEFYALVFTMHKWRRDCLQFSAWKLAAAYWARGVDVDALIDVLDEASAEQVSVSALEAKLFATFGEREPKEYTTRCATYCRTLFSDAERLGASHPHYAPLMQAAELLKGIQKGKTK